MFADFDLGPGELSGLQVVEALRPQLPDSTYVIMSGSFREVPDGVPFVEKTDTSGIVSVIEQWRSSS